MKSQKVYRVQRTVYINLLSCANSSITQTQRPNVSLNKFEYDSHSSHQSHVCKYGSIECYGTPDFRRKKVVKNSNFLTPCILTMDLGNDGTSDVICSTAREVFTNSARQTPTTCGSHQVGLLDHGKYLNCCNWDKSGAQTIGLLSFGRGLHYCVF